MYRSRPTDNLKDDVLRFLSSMGEDHSILYYDIVGSEAHSIMLHEMGHITDGELKKICLLLRRQRKTRLASGPKNMRTSMKPLRRLLLNIPGWKLEARCILQGQETTKWSSM